MKFPWKRCVIKILIKVKLEGKMDSGIKVIVEHRGEYHEGTIIAEIGDMVLVSFNGKTPEGTTGRKYYKRSQCIDPDGFKEMKRELSGL